MAVVPGPGWSGFVGKEMAPIEVINRLKTERLLSDADIDQAGITIVSAKFTKEELGWAEPNPLIKIPYWGITGEKLLDNRGNQLCRYRRVVVNAKGERYTQRAGTGSRHYLPVGPDWVSISRDTSVDIYYTEGEFKAISGCRHLGPTIANAGVTSWRGVDGELAAPLNDFEWKGRNVFICYDAESSSTPSVPLKANIAKSLGELAVDLHVRGATVQSLLIAKTTTFVEGTKLGLDDYFAAGGGVDALLATATAPEVDEDWARMFELYALFQGTKPHIKNIVSGDVYTPRDFREMIERKTRLRDGKPAKLADIYREHDEANTFSAYVFDPSLPTGYLRVEKKFNTWQGFVVTAAQSENYDAHIADFQKFTDGVFGPDNSDYFLDWAAHIFQRPGELTTISPILVSRVKGVGKSLTGAVLRALIGVRGSFVGGIDGLTEKHTGELEGKLFVQVDEADALFDGKESRLKALDSDFIRIRKMNTDGYTVPNILRKLYTTNENAAFRIAADERRYWVVRVRKTHADGEPGAEWNTWLRQVIVPMLKEPAVLSDIMYYLQSRDIGEWDPGAPVPRTEDMMDMVEAGESKKHVMADQLYERLSELGVWAVDSTLRSVDNKMWGEVTAILKDHGGRSVGHVYKDKDVAKRVSIMMMQNRYLDIVEDAKKGAHLAPGQLAADDVKTMLLKTKAQMDIVRALVDSSKF